MIDLWTSRRDKFIECAFYSQNKDETFVSNNELIYNRLPTGYFFIKEISSYSSENQVLDGAFMIGKTTITVQTDDDVSLLERNDLVAIGEYIYIVVDIQSSPYKNQKQFLKDDFVSKTTYISLRR